MSYFERLSSFIAQLCFSPELCKLFVMYVKREIGDYQFNQLIGKFSKYHKMDLNKNFCSASEFDDFGSWCQKWNKNLEETIRIAKTPWLDLDEDDNGK